eukprot:1138190-Pelagomonas_calceolata.AAC.1
MAAHVGSISAHAPEIAHCNEPQRTPASAWVHACQALLIANEPQRMPTSAWVHACQALVNAVSAYSLSGLRTCV